MNDVRGWKQSSLPPTAYVHNSRQKLFRSTPQANIIELHQISRKIMNTSRFSSKDIYDIFRKGGWEDATTYQVATELDRRLTCHFNRHLHHHHPADICNYVQETKYRLLTSQERIDPAQSPWAWVLGIADKVAKEIIRKEEREKRRLEEYAKTQVERRRLMDRQDPNSITDERFALLSRAKDSLLHTSRLSPKTINAGWELLLGMPRMEVQEKYGITRAGTYHAASRIRKKLKEAVRSMAVVAV